MTDDERVETMLARAIDPHSFRLADMGGPNEEMDRQACEAARRKSRAALAALNAAGLVIVPREPTPHMLAAALPLARETPSVAQKRLAAAAVGLLPPVSDAHLRDGILCAAELARDYTAMCDAALSRHGEGT